MLEKNMFGKIKETVSKITARAALLTILSSAVLEANAQSLEKKYTLEDINKIKTETLVMEQNLKPEYGSIDVGNKTIEYKVDWNEEIGNTVHIKEVYKDSTISFSDGQIDKHGRWSTVGDTTGKTLPGMKTTGLPKFIQNEMDNHTVHYAPFYDEKDLSSLSLWNSEGGRVKKDKDGYKPLYGHKDFTQEETIQVIAGFAVLFKGDVAIILGEQQKKCPSNNTHLRSISNYETKTYHSYRQSTQVPRTVGGSEGCF